MNSFHLFVLLAFVATTNQYPAVKKSPFSIWASVAEEAEGLYQVSTEKVSQAKTLLSNDVPQAFNDEVSTLAEESTRAINGISDAAATTVKNTEAFLNNTYSNVANRAEDVADKAKDFVEKSYTDVSAEISEAATNTENFFTSSWNSVTSWFSGAGTSIGNFFSSSWNTVKSWWTELEEEVKDFIHFLLKIINIVIALAIFVFILWILNKVRKAYNLVQSQIGLPAV